LGEFAHEHPTKGLCVPRRIEQVEEERLMQLAGAKEVPQLLVRDEPTDLADQDAFTPVANTGSVAYRSPRPIERVELPLSPRVAVVRLARSLLGAWVIRVR
jgi:hypothetical protein